MMSTRKSRNKKSTSLTGRQRGKLQQSAFIVPFTSGITHIFS